eukprot:scaffold333955_cov24-Prasinocladus_malaysianus.AAC.1
MARIRALLGDFALLTEEDMGEEGFTPKVQLMTIHASKGLEFAAVFVAGCEEKILPSSQAVTVTLHNLLGGGALK